MNRLLRYVVQGFGWELGREAARSALDEAAERVDGGAVDPENTPKIPSERELARERRRREKAEAKRRRAAAKAARRQEAEVEAELARLKKRIRED